MVNLPDAPPTFRPAPESARPWWWRMEKESGEEVTIEGEYADQKFPSQADAESWVGEFWSELAEQGVDAVTLFETDRQVYGPMSLHA